MPNAIWNNGVIAEAPADEIQRAKGNAHFPLSAVIRKFLRPSDTHGSRPWKGIASYCDVSVDGKMNDDAKPTILPSRRQKSRIPSPFGMT